MATAQHQVPDWEGVPKKGLFEKYGFGFSRSEQSDSDNVVSDKEMGGVAAPPVTKMTLAERFNRILPPNRTYFGRSRKLFLIAVSGLFLLFILAFGLGLGLGLKKSKTQDLPLPSNSQTFTGDITYYAPGLGACGITSTSSDAICAVSHIIYDAASTGSNPNANPLCGKKIRISRYNEAVGAERSIDVTVVDRCVGCKADDLDLSVTYFDKLAEEAQGRVTATWAWLD